MNRFTFRPATAHDRAWVWATKKACMHAYVEQTWGRWDEHEQEEFFTKNFLPEEIRIVAVEGRDAGYLHTTVTHREISLNNIMVAPEFQGRGLGTAVLADLLASAREHGQVVRLRVLKVNEAAQRLYRRIGFHAVEETPTHVRMMWP